MAEAKPIILVVDDEPVNLAILSESLKDEGYEPVCAENGQIAWDLLKQNPKHYSAVLLDRMMPVMDGMEVLALIKQHPQLNTLPVIIQTAKAGKGDMKEGLEAGAHYYLTKPFDANQLINIVRAAVGDYQHYCTLRNESSRSHSSLGGVKEARFELSTLDEVRNLAALLSNTCPHPEKIVTGLAELLINAIEHGNLGITYKEKTALVVTGHWAEEVVRRQKLPENINKKVLVTFERTPGEIRFFIQDQGQGFEWEKYLHITTDRAFHCHGRGIAMAKMMSFDRLEYLGSGNQLLAIVSLTDHEQ